MSTQFPINIFYPRKGKRGIVLNVQKEWSTSQLLQTVFSEMPHWKSQNTSNQQLLLINKHNCIVKNLQVCSHGDFLYIISADDEDDEFLEKFIQKSAKQMLQSEHQIKFTDFLNQEQQATLNAFYEKASKDPEKPVQGFHDYIWNLLKDVSKKPDSGIPLCTLTTKYIIQVCPYIETAERGRMEKFVGFLKDLFLVDNQACVCFLEQLVEHPDWNVFMLLKCPFVDVRSAFISLVIGCIKKLSPKYDEKYVLEDDDGKTTGVKRQKSLVVKYMDSVLALMEKTCFQYNKNCAELFQLLSEFTLIGSSERRYFIEREVISAMLKMLIDKQVITKKSSGFTVKKSIISAYPHKEV